MTLYRIIYTAWPEVSVSLGVQFEQAAQPLSTPRASAQAGLRLAARVDRAYRQPANMHPGTFCYH